MSKRIFLTWVVVAGTGLAGRAAEPTGPFRAEWKSLARHEAAPKWFRDAKFGIYFHWGVYSVPAFGSEWYPRNMHIKTRREYKHHVETYGDPTKFGYPDFVPMFKAEKFDADAWADLFARAGARYAGPVCEHHDGYAMWASKLTPWNAKDTGPKRDITGELAAAIRKRGMKFVATFHHARNCLWQIERGGRKVWTGHYEFVKKDFPSLLEDPRRAIMYGWMPREKFLEMWLGKLKEVIDNYQPDLMWFDSWLDQIPEEYRKRYLAYYFNRAAEWGKDVVVTHKQNDLPRDCTVDDYEKGRLNRVTEFAWLTDDTISRGSWCYTRDLRIKPLSEVLHVFIDIVSKNGCLLLNISPKADGTIPKNQRDVLEGMGRWLSRYGEAIYETRPWVKFGEGPTRLRKSGHFVGTLTYTPKDIRFTRNGDTLYAIVLGRPGGTVTIRSLAKGQGLCGGEVKKVTLLGSGRELEFARDAEGLKVKVPDGGLDELAVPLKIEGLKIEGFRPDLSIRFEGGTARLGAEAASLSGPGLAVETKVPGQPNLGFWDDPSATASWEVKFPAPGTYTVRGRLAAIRPGTFRVTVGGAALAAQPPKTGAWEKFQTVRLGTIEVKQAGRQTVKVVPVADGWSAMNLAWLELTAAK